MAFLQPPTGTNTLQMLDEPMRSAADLAEKQGKSELVCFTCAGRGIILCTRGIFRARLTCHACDGDGVVRKKV